jgi:hypothetical protein
LNDQARIIYTLQRHEIHSGNADSLYDGEGKENTNRAIQKRKTGPGSSTKTDACEILESKADVKYCELNSELDEELTFWHTELQCGNTVAQVEIDRRLFACCLLETGSIPTHHSFLNNPSSLYLDYVDTLHAKNLPDLIWTFRQRLVMGLYQTALQESIFRYSIPCIRKSKHPFTSKVTSVENTEELIDPLCSVYINVLYGTLLALYPHCSKSPTFQIRKDLFRTLYSVSTSSLKVQQEFLTKYINLTRLCFMEYFVFVLEKYCNVERNLMCKCLNYDVYTNLCQTSSDLFRQNCLQGNTLDWKHIDHQAFKTTDKIIRTTRIGIKLSTNPGNIIGIRKLGAVWSGSPVNTDLTRRLVLDMPPCFWHMQHSFMYTQMITEWLAQRNIEHCVATLSHNVSVVHQMIHVYQMPTNFVMKQVHFLLKHFDGDSMLLNSICKKTICLKCIMNIKQACNAHTVVNNTRMCLVTCSLMCNKCNNADFLVKINLLGKWLQVERHLYYICPFCINVHCWNGTGCEFLSCDQQATVLDTKKKSKTTNRKVAKRSGKRQYDCYICQKQCNSISLSVVCVQTFSIKQIALCSKHFIPNHVHKFITNTDNLERYFVEHGVSVATVVKQKPRV